MSSPLAQARCFIHLHREAAARCPACGRFYCRECVTEHEGRVVCRGCLEAVLQDAAPKGRGWWACLATWTLAMVGYLLVVVVFYGLGRVLLNIPSKFHSGIFFE